MNREQSLHDVELFSALEKLSAVPERRPGAAAAFRPACNSSLLAFIRFHVFVKETATSVSLQ